MVRWNLFANLYAIDCISITDLIKYKITLVIILELKGHCSTARSAKVSNTVDMPAPIISNHRIAVIGSGRRNNTDPLNCISIIATISGWIIRIHVRFAILLNGDRWITGRCIPHLSKTVRTSGSALYGSCSNIIPCISILVRIASSLPI